MIHKDVGELLEGFQDVKYEWQNFFISDAQCYQYLQILA